MKIVPTTLSSVPTTGGSPLTVITVGPNSSALRRTQLSLILGSIASAAGSRVLYVCGDRGVGGLSSRLRGAGAYHLEHFPVEEDRNYGERLVKKASSVGATVIIIDFGPNVLLDIKPRITLDLALSYLKTAGHHIHVLLSLVRGKAGLGEDSEKFARRFERVGTVSLAFHGGHVAGECPLLDEMKSRYATFDVPSNSIAVLNLITKSGSTPFDWCSAPIEGYGRGAGMIARTLWNVANTPVILSMLNCQAALPVLYAMAKDQPEPSDRGEVLKWQVRDDLLKAKSDKRIALVAMQILALDEPDYLILAVAKKCIGLSLECRQIREKAERGDL